MGTFEYGYFGEKKLEKKSKKKSAWHQKFPKILGTKNSKNLPKILHWISNTNDIATITEMILKLKKMVGDLK